MKVGRRRGSDVVERGGAKALREAGTFALFLGAYVALFIGIPPVSLCSLGACGLSPRPEAFLLAAALAYGAPAILGTSGGVFVAALLYEAMHPTGTTLADAAAALVAFLASTTGGAFLLRKLPSLEGAVLSTGLLMGLLTVLLGTFAVAGGRDPATAYLDVLAEGLLPINVAGLAFLVWAVKRGPLATPRGNL